MDGIVAISIISLLALLVVAGRPSQAAIEGMEDTPVSIDNIRKGVTNGWYTCVLVRVDGTPAVRLYGKMANGKSFTDVFPVTESDWNTLKNEGYQVV